MPPRRPPDRDVLAPEAEEEPKTPLEQFIDVFHEDWKALPLAAKLAKIGGTLGNVPKKGVNPNQHYRYVRETDLVAAIRPYLSAAGILLTFSVTGHEIIPRDAKSMLTHITVHWTVTDGKESIEGDMPGYGMDTGDKSVYKAVTGAKKYILMTLFLVDTGDDPENEPQEKPQRIRAGTVASRPGLDLSGYGDVPDEPEPEPIVEPLGRTDIVRGGHTTESTDTQMTRVVEAVRQRGWTARVFLQFIRETLEAELAAAPEDDPVLLRDYIRAILNSLTPADMGKLLMAIETNDGY